jgi:hypothetical protein
LADLAEGILPLVVTAIAVNLIGWNILDFWLGCTEAFNTITGGLDRKSERFYLELLAQSLRRNE